MPRPRRDIRFWWVNEFASEEHYFRENPQEPRKLLLDLNQDMVGARQSLGGRVQYGSRLPWSLPHALEDVMESVLGTVRAGNTSLLTTRGTALPVPFTREITAVKGSREPFHARMVPYYDSTDHHAFTPAHIGVPATSLTNWPDEFIHSTGDDLDQLDATQLERNAVVVAAVALYFGSAGDGELPLLASYSGARGVARLAADGATAQQLLFAGTDRARGLPGGAQPHRPFRAQGARCPGVDTATWGRQPCAGLQGAAGRQLRGHRPRRSGAASEPRPGLRHPRRQAGITGVVGRREGPGGAHLQPRRHHR